MSSGDRELQSRERGDYQSGKMPNVTHTVLVIDDNQAVGTALDVLLSLHDIRVEWAGTPDEGLTRLGDSGVDLVIQDMNFRREATSGEEGVKLFHAIRECHPDMPVILLTAWTYLEHAVDLVRAGAADYLAKPWDDDKLVTAVKNLLLIADLSSENRNLTSERETRRSSLSQRLDLRGLVYASETMHDLLNVTAQIAHADIPVLITGANGAGKELIGDIIHANSAVKDGPYVKVNVGALPAELMEAELFGAEPGAYTGATKARKGRFETADGGTLFLDEIGNLSPEGQMKLLRVLQTGEFERLGSSRTHQVHVRVITATNADLKALIRDGRFREDLYYRLNVIELKIPPLADRRGDILPLAQAFLDKDHSLTPGAERRLQQYDWPGNVRELKNTIRRASLLCKNKTLDASDLGLEDDREVEPSAEDVRRALDTAGGVVAKAARKLGLSRQALYRRMEKFNIPNPD